MATMGGGSAAAPALDPDDDPRIKNDEIIWHLIDPSHYVDDPNFPGQKRITSASFSHSKSGVSFLRRTNPKIDVQYVQARFPGFGIAEFKVEDVRTQARCLFVIEQDPQWPPDSHIVAYAAPGKGVIRKGRISALKRLAAANLILKPTP
jgi:hypothetical protein